MAVLLREVGVPSIIVIEFIGVKLTNKEILTSSVKAIPIPGSRLISLGMDGSLSIPHLRAGGAVTEALFRS